MAAVAVDACILPDMYHPIFQLKCLCRADLYALETSPASLRIELRVWTGVMLYSEKGHQVRQEERSYGRFPSFWYSSGL